MVLEQGVQCPEVRPSARLKVAGVLATVALAALVTACTPASPSPGPTTTSPSASPVAPPTPTATEQPTPEPTPEPTPSESPTVDDPNDRSELLEQPAAMQNEDRAGAIAAAKYYMGLFEYVFLTGDTSQWEAMALPDCEFCAVVAESVRELHTAGRHRVSGPPKWLGKAKVNHIEAVRTWEVTIRATVSASTTYDESGKVVEENDSGDGTVTLGMVHNGERWQTKGVVVTVD